MGSQIRDFRIFKAHIWVKYHTLQGTGSKAEKTHKYVPPPRPFYFKQIGLGVTRLKVKSNVAGTILLRFTEFWQLENKMAISEMATKVKCQPWHR